MARTRSPNKGIIRGEFKVSGGDDRTPIHAANTSNSGVQNAVPGYSTLLDGPPRLSPISELISAPGENQTENDMPELSHEECIRGVQNEDDRKYGPNQDKLTDARIVVRSQYPNRRLTAQTLFCSSYTSPRKSNDSEENKNPEKTGPDSQAPRNPIQGQNIRCWLMPGTSFLTSSSQIAESRHRATS
ncbi:hypothetical protein SISSUDRAFT_1036658 [Sistotremastrum suecicum HHB10207 ss-3]|uniref:Uncharacterized protein n=1 Tax=Sistotremastrum suecicum HHB10207 ss-3 TaxID=1314776 RepID=A0A165Z5D1_9AGAM|nr:hypothetical protein SISSUDRAFT_1036658 [Sistotremastrum suecicum HHB10207 ss-3]